MATSVVQLASPKWNQDKVRNRNWASVEEDPLEQFHIFLVVNFQVSISTSNYTAEDSDPISLSWENTLLLHLLSGAWRFPQWYYNDGT